MIRDDVTYISMQKQHRLTSGRRAPPLCHFLWPDHSGALRACKTLDQESSKKQPFKLNLHLYFVPKYDSGRKGSNFQYRFPRNNEDGESTFVIYCTKLGLHESSLNGNYHETGGFVSIFGPGIDTDLFGDVPSPLFYEIVKEKDGRHFANKKVFGITDLGPKQFRIPIINFGVNHCWARAKSQHFSLKEAFVMHLPKHETVPSLEHHKCLRLGP